MIKNIYFLSFCFIANVVMAQSSFYFGADLSYVNEMEDCGVTYYENQAAKDPYTIFEHHGCNLVRLRLWHTPKWYDNINVGNRYSDLKDCKLSIARAKESNMEVLLDFHLSDNWADPSKQLIPEAWLPVVDDLELLKDSLYHYIFETLTELNHENLLPEMVQIGNETNKGILLSPQDDAVWTLDWNRNAALFNEALKAVEDFELQSSKEVKTMIHIAGPSNAEWWLDGFASHGVTNFDMIGLSYYWAWHAPTTIQNTGTIITNLKNRFPEKEIFIVETAYLWTSQWNDNANNTMSQTHPNYGPPSPISQRDWLIDLTKEVMNAGGKGVVYWEPAWVSSPCYTQWGQGSHQENAIFFDFNNELMLPGGIEWMAYDYSVNSPVQEVEKIEPIEIWSNGFSGDIVIKVLNDNARIIKYSVVDVSGRVVLKDSFVGTEKSFKLRDDIFGWYVVLVEKANGDLVSKEVFYQKK